MTYKCSIGNSLQGRDTNYRFLQCLSVNVSTVPTFYVLFCYSDTSLQQHNLSGPFDSAITKFNCNIWRVINWVTNKSTKNSCQILLFSDFYKTSTTWEFYFYLVMGLNKNRGFWLETKICYYSDVNKVKISPLQAMKVHGECGCKGSHIHSHGTRKRQDG